MQIVAPAKGAKPDGANAEQFDSLKIAAVVKGKVANFCRAAAHNHKLV